MAWSWGTEAKVSARYERLFREARRNFNDEVRAIFARHAADGLLKSGKTIKVVVRALDDATLAAISDALAGIAVVTDHAGRQRKQLVKLLTASLAVHHGLIVERAEEAIGRIGLASDFKHALTLIEVAKVRHAEAIADFEEGWTAPVTKPWNERHPILAAAIVGIMGIVLGWAGTAIFG